MANGLRTYRVLFAPIALIGLIHIAGGAAVLFAPQAVYVSQLSGLALLFGARPLLIAAVLIVVGVLAVAAELLVFPPRERMVLVAPQQLVLVVQALGVGVAAWQGVYPDGYVPVPGNWSASSWFIIGDQAALLLLCLSHTFELFFADPLGRLYSRYEARLAVEREALEAAQAELDKFRETEFWMRLAKDMTTADAEKAPNENTGA